MNTEYRDQIDRIDDEIVRLFEERMAVSAKIAQYKQEKGLPILDKIRERDKLKKQFARIYETGCVLCCTGRALMRPDGSLTGRVIGVKKTISYRDLLWHNQISCSSVVLLTEVARQYPMIHEDAHEDYITWMKVLRDYGDAAAINEPLLRYRLSESGKSGKKLKSAAMTFRVYRYMGFGPLKSALLFISYAIHGVWKYRHP